MNSKVVDTEKIEKDTALKIAELFMKEIGLERHAEGINIVDQDTGVALQMSNKFLIYPGIECPDKRMTISFDPACSWKILNMIFSYFLKKFSEENDEYVSLFYNYNGAGNKDQIAVKLSNEKIYKSHPYYKECLRYLDIIMQLNGERYSDIDLRYLDSDEGKY